MISEFKNMDRKNDANDQHLYLDKCGTLAKFYAGRFSMGSYSSTIRIVSMLCSTLHTPSVDKRSFYLLFLLPVNASKYTLCICTNSVGMQFFSFGEILKSRVGYLFVIAHRLCISAFDINYNKLSMETINEYPTNNLCWLWFVVYIICADFTFNINNKNESGMFSSEYIVVFFFCWFLFTVPFCLLTMPPYSLLSI